jgi:hypothetical protein
MRYAWFTIPEWLALVYVSILLTLGQAVAQPSPIESALRGLAAPEPEARSEAFRALVAPFNSSGKPEIAVAQLLAAHPQQADQIKIALFAALERESAYSESLVSSGQSLSEDLLYYCDALGQAVGALRDQRALKGLLAAQGTVGIDPEFVGDLCPDAVDAIIDKARQPERYFQGEPLHVPGRAIVALGYCLKRAASMRSQPDAITKIRSVLMAGLDNPDTGYRQAAVRALFPLRNDPGVRAKLELVAGSDPFLGPVQPRESQPKFWIREDAARILRPPDGDESWYVTKAAEARRCRVQEASVASAGELYIGPFPKADEAKHSMCNHVDPGTRNPSLCWKVEPANTCTK